jgi:type IV pilus assembly protein PilK
MSLFEIPEMESEEFLLWQSMLEKKTGLWMPATRKTFLVTSLQSHMRDRGIKNYQDFYHLFDEGRASNLDWAKLVDSLTVHETCFYRDKDSLNLMTSFCRNKVLKTFYDFPYTQQHLQIWSVGCSTGEEVYTLALEMEKLNVSVSESIGKSIYYGVTGIDVSYPSLAIAREGIYSDKNATFLPKTSLNPYFDHLPDGYIQLKESIRKRTCFMQANILELDDCSKQSFDVIYCQNVMIYFKQERKNKILESFEKHLNPGGMLILGHGEITSFSNSNLTRVDNKHCLAFIKNEKNNTKIPELA